jgi:hypothetical protein
MKNGQAIRQVWIQSYQSHISSSTITRLVRNQSVCYTGNNTLSQCLHFHLQMILIQY